MSESQLDPRLFASSLPPRTQSYPGAPQHNSAAHPYYLSPPTHQQPAQLPQPAPLGALDPTLEQTSPTGPEASQDDDEQDEDGDLDGYAHSSNEQGTMGEKKLT
jgi:hypothetical protein